MGSFVNVCMCAYSNIPFVFDFYIHIFGESEFED